MSQSSKAPLIIVTLIFLTFPVAMGLANTLLALFLAAWLFSGNFRQRWLSIRSNPVPLAALLLYGIVLLGVTYSTAPAEDIGLHLSKYSKLLFVALFCSVLTDQTWQRRCMHAFAAAMLFILVSTWLNIWFVLPWSASKTPGWGQTHHVIGDYITQNVMMSFFVLLALLYAHAQKPGIKRYAGWAVALMAAISITHLSLGRTGYLLLATALVVFTFSVLKGRTLWFALVAAAIGLAIALASSQVLSERFKQAMIEAEQSDVNNQTSIGHRLYNYKTSTQMITEKPVLGWGTGAYHTDICKIVKKSEWCEIFSWHPHNQFLFFWIEHGLLGFLAYAALIAAMIRLALRDPNPESRTLLLGLAGLLIVDSLFNSPLWSSRESHFFTFMMALLAAQSSRACVAKSEKKDENKALAEPA